MSYPSIPGTSNFAPRALPEVGLPEALTTPPAPTVGGKNIFAYWHTGIHTLKPYLLRNVLAWYQKYSPFGWNIYVLDRVEGSPLNVASFIDFSDPQVVPDVLREGAVTGQYAFQHTSDLCRFPLLLRYGGVYSDVGNIIFANLDLLFEQHINNPDSPLDYAGLTMGDTLDDISIVNFFMMSTPSNPLVQRAHSIFLALWKGKQTTTGAHAHPLVSHVPLMKVPDNVSQSGDDKDNIPLADTSMTDYAIQIQSMGAAQRWLDQEADWDGPAYVRNKCYLLSMIQHAYVNEQLTGWNSAKQHRLFLTPLPQTGQEGETKDQLLARQIVEQSVAGSFALKLAHGISAKVFGAPTLGMRWRDDEGSDCVEETYGGWLRWATTHSMQDGLLKRLDVEDYEPTMRASLASML